MPSSIISAAHSSALSSNGPKGLPPLGIDTLYVITEDDQLRDGKTVLFIGLASNCVSTVFSFPAKLYREFADTPGNAS